MSFEDDILQRIKDSTVNTLQKAADEIERLRKGEDVAWERFANSIQGIGIGSVTARACKILPSDDDHEFNLMVERGTQAWADVPDSTSWLEILRGGQA